jgi:hypothetical protein
MRGKLMFGATTIASVVLFAVMVSGALSAPVKDRPSQLAGTWLSTVTLATPPPGVDASFLALDTFSRGGAVLVSSNQVNPGSRSLAHGEWTRIGNRRFASTFTWFRFDPTGKPIGTQRVQRTMVLSADGDSFESTDTVQVLAPDGTVLASTQATETARRISG